jgi:transketolase
VAQTVGDQPLDPRAIRRIILEQSHRAQAGHIGSALSIADVIAALYGAALHIPSPGDPDRDRFILSKGHAVLALYAALHLKGWLSKEQLDSYAGNGTLLGMHPERELRGVDFSTGSLGHGLSMAAGAAMAARRQRRSSRAFVLLSDAECNEGSTWEAAMFAAHHGLRNLIAIVDVNGQQALGYTKEVLDLEPLEARWRASHWDVRTVDGHDTEALANTFRHLKADPEEVGRPHVVIARTTFGKGVTFMQSKIEWHYLPISDEQVETALRELDPPE